MNGQEYQSPQKCSPSPGQPLQGSFCLMTSALALASPFGRRERVVSNDITSQTQFPSHQRHEVTPTSFLRTRYANTLLGGEKRGEGRGFKSEQSDVTNALRLESHCFGYCTYFRINALFKLAVTVLNGCIWVF